jgi:pectate lyase
MRRASILAFLLAACGPSESTDGGRSDAGRSDGGARVDAFRPPRDGGPILAGRSFPGAEGFGTDSPGGRGGRVFVVTTLDWDGPGSFAEALRATEPRIIVFRVSGVIDVPVSGVVALGEEHSFVTIAGQTSPGGITFRGGGDTLNSYQAGFHDLVVRHVRFRGRDSYDNVSLNTVSHIVFDHCDFSGGEDETLDITYGSDVTVQWSTITNSGPEGQRYGFLLAYPPTTRISFHHNFSAHHVNRCLPHMHWADVGTPAEGAEIEITNNVIYDCEHGNVLSVSSPPSGELRLNLVGNVAIVGPATDEVANITTLGTNALVYAEDNVYEPGGGHEVFSIFDEHRPAPSRHAFPAITTQASGAARALVLAEAGAWPRDPMNARTIEDLETLGGSLGQVGDALIEDGPEPPPDADLDGMPDAWESERGLDPNDASDSSEDRNGDELTNIEEYLADRALELLP